MLGDPVRLTSASLGGQAALLGPHRVIATLVLVSPVAVLLLDPVRVLLAELAGVEAGASAWEGRLAVRLPAPDGDQLRQAVLAVLAALGLPKWCCRSPTAATARCRSATITIAPKPTRRWCLTAERHAACGWISPQAPLCGLNRGSSAMGGWCRLAGHGRFGGSTGR